MSDDLPPDLQVLGEQINQFCLVMKSTYRRIDEETLRLVRQLCPVRPINVHSRAGTRSSTQHIINWPVEWSLNIRNFEKAINTFMEEAKKLGFGNPPDEEVVFCSSVSTESVRFSKPDRQLTTRDKQHPNNQPMTYNHQVTTVPLSTILGKEHFPEQSPPISLSRIGSSASSSAASTYSPRRNETDPESQTTIHPIPAASKLEKSSAACHPIGLRLNPGGSRQANLTNSLASNQPPTTRLNKDDAEEGPSVREYSNKEIEVFEKVLFSDEVISRLAMRISEEADHGALQPDKVGYFYPESDQAVHTGKVIIFKDVFPFVDRLTHLAVLHGEIKVRQVFPLVLRGSALQWHCELSDMEREYFTTSPLAKITERIVLRFRTNPIKAFEMIMRETFTMKDVRDGKSLREYVMKKFSLARAAEISDVYYQLLAIFTGIDESVRVHIVTPTKETKITDFLSSVDAQQANFEELAFEAARQDQSSPGQYNQEEAYERYLPTI